MMKMMMKMMKAKSCMMGMSWKMRGTASKMMMMITVQKQPMTDCQS